MDPDEIVVVQRRIDPARLRRLLERNFLDMVKIVVDVRLRVIAVGGELHADAERVLLDRGSRQVDLWGANYYPGRGRGACLEYSALINIRPAHGNAAMEILDESVRRQVEAIAFELIGEGEPL